MLVPVVPKNRVITRRIGGLSAIQNPEVQSVIWSRNLAAPALRELGECSQSMESPIEFVTLTTDPHDRVRQQLGKAGCSSHFLAFDIALLVTVFGELAGTQRVFVHFAIWGDGQKITTDKKLQMACVYPGPVHGGTGRRSIAAHVSLFRDVPPDEKIFQRTPKGFFLGLAAIPDKNSATFRNPLLTER